MDFVVGSFQGVVFIVEIVIGAILAIVFLRSRIPQQTIDQQNKLIAALNGRLDALETENKLLQSKHTENQNAISRLSGQIEVYKELPLKAIAQSLAALEVLPAEFEKISKKQSDAAIKAFREIVKDNKKRL